MADQSKYIWFNGEMLPWEKAKIHVMSHVLHYGSGVFEGIKCYLTDKGPAIFKLSEHIDRLFSSAQKYNMEIPVTLFHGLKDEVVPIKFSKKILKVFIKAKKKLIKINNGNHSLSRKGDLKKICKELSYIISNL